jgi:hypothetical protein
MPSAFIESFRYKCMRREYNMRESLENNQAQLTQTIILYCRRACTGLGSLGSVGCQRFKLPRRIKTWSVLGSSISLYGLPRSTLRLTHVIFCFRQFSWRKFAVVSAWLCRRDSKIQDSPCLSASLPRDCGRRVELALSIISDVVTSSSSKPLYCVKDVAICKSKGWPVWSKTDQSSRCTYYHIMHNLQAEISAKGSSFKAAPTTAQRNKVFLI